MTKKLTSQRAALLLHMVCKVLRQDLDHGLGFIGSLLPHYVPINHLGRQLVHGVVLVVSPGQVTEHVPGELVDPLDHLGHVGLEVG